MAFAPPGSPRLKDASRRHLGPELAVKGPEIKKAAQKLREIIDAQANPLGSTPDGTAWCLKALHPADPLTEVSGVPDESTNTSACLNWQQNYTAATPAAGDPTWDCEILFKADPTSFASVKTTSSGGTVAYALVPNEALGANVPSAVTALIAGFEHWRLAYAGLSIHLTASMTTNQGTIVAAQYPVRSQDLGSIQAEDGYTSLYPAIRYTSANVEPDYENLVKMPNSYQGEARDGLYMPMKLDSNHVRWHTESDRRLDASGWATGANVNLTIPMANLGTYPWPTLSNPAFYDAVSHGWSGTYVTMKMCNDLVGGIYIRGLDKAATLMLTMRQGYEVRCIPGSAFTSFLKVSPEHDMAAITNYYKISRQLKDAYPVEYNDLGKLWDLIKGAASVVSPMLSLIPGGGLIRGAGTVAGKIGDALFSKSKKDIVSATDMEKARKAVSQAIVTANSVKKAKKKVAGSGPPTKAAAKTTKLAIQRAVKEVLK